MLRWWLMPVWLDRGLQALYLKLGSSIEDANLDVAEVPVSLRTPFIPG